MEALTFLNKQLNDGDRVRLTLKYGGRVFEGYFGGYKCFEGTTSDIHYNVFPVFYRPGKKGQYVRRSLFERRSPYIGFSEIEDVERIVTEYRHIGYYNNPDDCYNLALRGHKAALQAWKKGYGDFHNVDNNEVFTDVVPDGKSEIIRFEGLPDFKEILTSQEEEDVFRKASEAYREALDNLTKSALRRIRTLKDHITEGPDKFLWLNRLNDVCPQLVIADGLSLSHVTGIHDDGETLSTEQDPVDVKDLLPDDLRDLVDLLEGIVKEIEKGDIKGVWNDDEEWYELYYATDGEEE